ncbi:hypothetical protein HU200_059184 [Digitaria exilis]|uniref:Uncharacterized protein n=1 Tax=Digitaria exilis TaxID=1010633 RepID=A0A835A8Q1_9POAL|nr:hypothetical protein HU200_059184 [Digitaria exilis]
MGGLTLQMVTVLVQQCYVIIRERCWLLNHVGMAPRLKCW